MVALYAHTALNCYATTDYTNFRDFSFAVRSYVMFRLSDDSDKVRLITDRDVSVFEADVSLPEIETLDALFREILRIEADIGICAGCGKRIAWRDRAYIELLSRTVISIPSSNRRVLSSFCFDCLKKSKNEG
jgi:hypothetical protein